MKTVKSKSKEMVVISLFDGLSATKVALNNTKGLKILRYYSSEVDEYAIKIANHNHPQDKPYRLGDVKEIDGYKLKEEIKKEFGDVDIFLVGGSPCQGFSMAGKRKGSSTKCGVNVTSLEQYQQLTKEGFEFDGQSYLFWEYVRLKEELDPTYFLLENVKVGKKWLPMFDEAMKHKAVFINSKVVSAQSRPRLYWSNIHVNIPKDRGVLLGDILEDLPLEKPLEKYMTDEFDGVSRVNKGVFNFLNDKKSKCLTVGAGHGNKMLLKLNITKPTDGVYRTLTPIECERLQMLPDNYTSAVSNTRRYHAIGNCFTVGVIELFTNGIVKDSTKKERYQPSLF